MNLMETKEKRMALQSFLNIFLTIHYFMQIKSGISDD